MACRLWGGRGPCSIVGEGSGEGALWDKKGKALRVPSSQLVGRVFVDADRCGPWFCLPPLPLPSGPASHSSHVVTLIVVTSRQRCEEYNFFSYCFMASDLSNFE